jgi:hypothetical protein
VSSLLAIAIAQERWDVAALCLLLGVSRAAEALPPDAVEALIELLALEPERPGRGRTPKVRDKRRARH